jgi:predicted  nucleic acid-binding Zn-ribbon protein
MPHITTCTRCGHLYEESSEETANAPGERLCYDCYRIDPERQDGAKRLQRFMASNNSLCTGCNLDGDCGVCGGPPARGTGFWQDEVAR